MAAKKKKVDYAAKYKKGQDMRILKPKKTAVKVTKVTKKKKK